MSPAFMCNKQSAQWSRICRSNLWGKVGYRESESGITDIRHIRHNFVWSLAMSDMPDTTVTQKKRKIEKKIKKQENACKISDRQISSFRRYSGFSNTLVARFDRIAISKEIMLPGYFKLTQLVYLCMKHNPWKFQVNRTIIASSRRDFVEIGANLRLSEAYST